MPDAVIATSAEDRIIYWNHAAETIFGFTSAEAKDRELIQLIVPPEYTEQAQRFRAEALENGLSVHESPSA
jgi:PAS domain S-box-containing protein